MTRSTDARCLRLLTKAADAASVAPVVERHRLSRAAGEVLVEVKAAAVTGAVLKELAPGFAGGHLKPFPIRAEAVYPLEDARRAFQAVAGSSRDRVILKP